MNTQDDTTIVDAWTDGACSGNPGPGGWGCLMIYGTHQRELCGGEAQTTNNRMEIMAVIMALQSLKRSCTVKVYSDSLYVCQGMTAWLPGWKKNNWRTASKQPVKNVDLWQALDEAVAAHRVSFVHVKGHAGIEYNERADVLANKGMQPFLK